MKDFKIKTALTALCAVAAMSISPFRVCAQYSSGPILEDLPRIPVDTVQTADPETSLILYSNNTWRYYRPSLAERLSDVSAFNEHWDTEHIFAYNGVELSDLPASLDINLISSMNDFHPPVIGKVFSKYGPRGRRSHNGVDIPLKIGDPIYATFDGKVRISTYNTGGYGNLVIVRHPNGLETWNAHLCKRNVEPGDYVKAGQIIGYGGSTGRSRGPHLHFEVRYCDQTFDPEHLFDFANGEIKYQTFTLEKAYFNIHSRASDELEEHEFDDLAYMNAGGVDLTSEEILRQIEESNSGKKNVARASLAEPEGGALYHTIASGDILGTISRRYGVTIDRICQLNNISRTTVLKIGRRLRIK